MAKRVGLVVLGDEVLRGEIREANLAFLIPLLNEWGAEVTLCAILPDDAETVERHLRIYRRETDLLVLTGGIGPTPDDITRDAVARTAGVPLVVHPDAKATLEAYYGDRITPDRLLMAQVPEGAVLIPNPVSAAPGFYIDGIAAFPGIPRLLREMFGWIRPFVEGPRRCRVTLYSKAPESAYAGIMREAMGEFRDVSVGSYPMAEGEYRVRIVFRAWEISRARGCADLFSRRFAEEGMEVLERREEPAGTGGEKDG